MTDMHAKTSMKVCADMVTYSNTSISMTLLRFKEPQANVQTMHDPVSRTSSHYIDLYRYLHPSPRPDTFMSTLFSSTLHCRCPSYSFAWGIAKVSVHRA